ncbi:MAG: hypothetical protein KF691_06565 [Phycisphaeraceae bacterium]|nr:hypothetical protein [Phycisphaeraceae bacterium]
MVQSNYGKGNDLELDVLALLEEYKSRNPQWFGFRRKPKIVQHDGQSREPDFELTLRSPGEELLVLLECQDRGRNRPDLSDKLHTLKAISDRNITMVIVRETISDALAEPLRKQGIPWRSLSGLRDYLNNKELAWSAFQSHQSIAGPSSAAGKPSGNVVTFKGGAESGFMGRLRRK